MRQTLMAIIVAAAMRVWAYYYPISKGTRT